MKKTVSEMMATMYLGVIFVGCLMLVALPWLYFEANAQTPTAKPGYVNDYIVEIVCPNGNIYRAFKVNSWRSPELVAHPSGHSSIYTYDHNNSARLLPVGWYCNITEVPKKAEEE